MKHHIVFKGFREYLKISRNEKLAVGCWLVILLVLFMGQAGNWLGFNIPVGYLIYEPNTGNTSFLFVLTCIFWPILAVYKVANIGKRKMIERRKSTLNVRKPNCKA